MRDAWRRSTAPSQRRAVQKRVSSSDLGCKDDILSTAGKLRPDPGSYLIFFPHYPLQSAVVVPALSCNRVGWGCPPSTYTVSFGIRRRSTVLPELLLLAASHGCGTAVCGTGVMMSKAAGILLALMVSGCLGYPATLNVNPREKKSPPSVESATPDIWPPPPTTVVSPQPRWLVIQAPSTNPLPQGGALLTKELQRQLRRVGCYNGEIDGVWTQSTRRAMQTFTNRVNATLPVERPGHVLLAILQIEPDRICNKPCSLGENLAPDGRCTPGAIAGYSIK
jgi:hypothetical protein